MTRRWALRVVLLLFAPILVALAASPSSADCATDLSLLGAQTVCFNSGAELRESMDSVEGRQYAYRLTQLCKDDGDAGTCDNPRACTNSGGVPGTLYSVSRRPIDTPGAPFAAYAVVCLTAEEEPTFEVITWRAVWRVMRTLEWPQAELVVQPVGGRTLINFETNFFTTTIDSSVQAVRLLGRDVEIEATPVSYTWHFGAGESLTTESPGAAHVDGREHEVFHVYTDAGVSVQPSVDVTYRGRYRIEGGRWFSIPEQLTVPGAGVPLEVVSARVHLVG